MKTWSRRDKGLAGLVLALGLALRLVPALTLPPPSIGGDAVAYDRLARNLASGHGYSMDEEAPYRPSAIRPPAYPVFVAAAYGLFGDSPRTVWLVQAVLDAGTCLLIFWLALRIFGRKPVALTALLLAAAMLPSQVYTRYLLTETLAAFLLTLVAAIWLLAQKRPVFYAAPLGVLAAALALCRPEFLLFPTVVIADLLVKHRRLTPLLGLAAGFVVAVLPWVVRNQLALGETALAGKAGGGTTLWAGTWGSPGELRVQRRRVEGREVLYLPPYAYDSLEEAQRAHRALATVEKERRGEARLGDTAPEDIFFELALERIRRAPLRWLRLRLREAPLLWQPSFANWSMWVADPFALNAFFGWTFFALAVGATALGWRAEKYRPLWFPIAYYSAVHFPFAVEFRYGVTMYPLVMLLSVGFFHELRERGKSRAKA
jgi:4-amino-4-deoxy-L-arabinose transferase-like glycosyltransferase